MNETSDSYILSLLKEPVSRDKGFLLLMDTYKQPIYWYIRRLVVLHEDAEDILQETFINAYRFANTFKGDSKIYTWLYRIATNECIKFFRKNKKWQKNATSISEKIVSGLSESEIENSESILIKFQQAILQLPERQRLVFNMRYYDELSYEDISQILNSSVNSLKTNYHYASEKIKQYLVEQA